LNIPILVDKEKDACLKEKRRKRIKVKWTGEGKAILLQKREQKM
jgi:hypothetical protein